jgi:hypothetical protein
LVLTAAGFNRTFCRSATSTLPAAMPGGSIWRRSEESALLRFARPAPVSASGQNSSIRR